MTSVLCSVCIQKIIAENDRVYCFGGCHKIFHAKCSDLHSSAVTALRQNVGLKYMCFDCRKSQIDLNALKNDSTEIAATVAAMSKSIEELDTKLSETVRSQLDILQSSLMSRVKELIEKEVSNFQSKSTTVVARSYADVARSTRSIPSAPVVNSSSAHRKGLSTPVSAITPIATDDMLCSNDNLDDDRGWLRSGKRRGPRSAKNVNNIRLTPVQPDPAVVPGSLAPKSGAIMRIEQTICFKPLEPQPVEVTKSDLQQNLDPVSYAVKNVRFKESGEAFIRCETREQALRMVSAAKKVFNEKYSVEIQNALKPRVKIIGFDESVTKDDLADMIKKQNVSLHDLEMQVVRLTKNEKHKSNPMTALIEVDASSLARLIKLQRLNIGWCRCRVVESINVNQCYNCFEYGHKASDCTAPACCPRCAECHEFSECESSYYKCVNCFKHNEQHKTDSDNQLDISHSSWSTRCPILQRRLNRAKQRIDYSS